ncbi:MAG: hypothetical protein ACTSXZ_00860, partial [Alphaproteobacteria bacterium]
MSDERHGAPPAALDLAAMLPPDDALDRMIDSWLAEDIGRIDLTTRFLIPKTATARFALNTRQDLVVCGMDIAGRIFRRHVPDCAVEIHTPDGTH